LNGSSNEHWGGPDLINGTHSILSDYDEWGAIMDMTTISPPEPFRNKAIFISAQSAILR